MNAVADVVVIGSGAGGATVALELAKRGADVLVLERGPRIRKVGTQTRALRFYDHGGLRRSKEGVTIYRALMAGGTTVVSCGNGLPVLENELRALGIDLSAELAETLRDLGVQPLADHLIGNGSRRIMDAANALGFEMQPMPKYFHPEKCVACGNCVLGCRADGKWSCLDSLDEMETHGGRLLTGVEVKRITIQAGRAAGVVANSRKGRLSVDAGAVVLAAGGLATPVLLERSGIEGAGKKLFADLFHTTYGVLRDADIRFYREPSMAVVTKKFFRSKGLVMAPFMDVPLALARLATIPKHLALHRRRNLLGIMTKIKDDSDGEVLGEGRFHKAPTAADQRKLDDGADLARQILAQAGVQEESIFTSKLCGAHPGGTAGIGDVVDTNLRTAVENLFVCDASVLPEAPGAPPIVTIVALAKRLGRQLAA
jgi:choline dehydrogenase-like flavoprotein